MNSTWRKWLFYVAAVYDGVLVLAFLFFWPFIFRLFDVTPPNHAGYVQFPALLLIIFGFIFLRIARDPEANRDLIVYGIGLKAAYSGLVFWHQLTAGVPAMWIPWAWIGPPNDSPSARVIRVAPVRPGPNACLVNCPHAIGIIPRLMETGSCQGERKGHADQGTAIASTVSSARFTWASGRARRKKKGALLQVRARVRELRDERPFAGTARGEGAEGRNPGGSESRQDGSVRRVDHESQRHYDEGAQDLHT